MNDEWKYHLADRPNTSFRGSGKLTDVFEGDPNHSPASDHRPPDDRTLRLGKTIRILHERMPSLLISPLPQDVLSPKITLHLFPSTHPHLPTVSGRLGYIAALWTAPVAWGCVPLLGNVRLEILSERMIRPASGIHNQHQQEKLIVKWRTCGKAFRAFLKPKMMDPVAAPLSEGRNVSESNKWGGKDHHGESGDVIDRIMDMLGRNNGGGDRNGRSRTSLEQSLKESGSSGLVRGVDPVVEDSSFTGLFIFEFDECGRVISHTIEHAEETDGYEQTSRFVSVTDWLLGKAWGKGEVEGSLALNLSPSVSGGEGGSECVSV